MLLVLLLSPGKFLVTVSMGGSNLGLAVHFAVPPMGGDGEGHAQSDDGHRAPPFVRQLILLGDASFIQKPVLRRPGPGVPG